MGMQNKNNIGCSGFLISFIDLYWLKYKMFGGLYCFRPDCFLIFYTRLLGLTESFYDEIKALPLEDDNSEQVTGFGYGSGKGKLKKRKVRPI